MIAAFRTGVRFECTRCGKCCTSLSSDVPVTLAEARRIGAWLGMRSLADFLRRRCRVRLATVGEGSRRVEVPMITLKSTRGRRCSFLTRTGECGIHAVKPSFCAHAPFVSDVAEGGERQWRAIAAACPGIGRGPVYRPGRIRRLLAREQALAREEFLEVRSDRGDGRRLMQIARRASSSREDR